jgi:class 3 adenylate cyclase
MDGLVLRVRAWLEMIAPLRALWERLSALGLADQSVGEQRRIRLTNQSALIGSVSCGSFAVAYAIAGPRYVAPMSANLAAVAALIGALFLNQRGARTLAKVAVLVPVNLVIVVASMLLGGRVGFVYYQILFSVVAFLLFSEDEWRYRISFSLGSTAVCIYSITVVPGSTRLSIAISPAAALAIDISSAVCVIATVVFIVHLFTGDTRRAEARLAEEHERSERLLRNILPGAISARLKENGEAIADGFAEVTVLFADLVGFTELSQKLSPAELVEMLNRTFSAFDDLAEQLGVEKIKTIGDCYMVAAGLPERRADHVEIIARMALGMREALLRINREGGYALRLRIGMHTGPVVAGVIGKRKFIYDLWGDTVNTASRMESSGEPGEIQVTREVKEHLEGRFELEPRGLIQVKGKGEMETYLLKGESPARA